MGTEIVDIEGVYVKRFYGGVKRGVCFSVRIDREFSQKELAEFFADVIGQMVVDGEGKKQAGEKNE